ncbi:amidohydrolase [Pontibacter sp. G13]|uniref:amidohydrolase n=1 Tax=Pontibacter sp. G13 TaxID=3074898 RepID=UPI00288AC128|nr:amidohydrolase [Pontibacter sp. G13]WNJ20838.1 amidohydrolase [Pontibacter sp. G13]
MKWSFGIRLWKKCAALICLGALASCQSPAEENAHEANAVDVAIKHGHVLTMDAGFSEYPEGTVLIKDGKIVEIGPDSTLSGTYSAKKVVDASGQLVMPGLVNTHTHAAMIMFRGLGDDMPLMQWLQEVVWPAEAQYVNPEHVRMASGIAMAEMIQGGITCFNDMYFFEEVTAELVDQIGMRAVLGEGVLNFPTPSAGNSNEGIARSIALYDAYGNHPRITVAFTPHAPYTCSAELLDSLATLARNREVPVHIHLSETEFEVNSMKEAKGKTPIAYLDSLGMLDQWLIGAHCVWLPGDDIPMLAEKPHFGAAHNPQSNMKLASGVAPVPAMLASGIAVGLATDGATSNNNLDIFQEMKAASLLQKVTHLDPTLLPARSVVAMATIGGAKALGLDRQIGSLEVDKQADIILVGNTAPHGWPLYDPYSHLVYALGASDVQTVMVDGQLLMEDRTLLTYDLSKGMKDAETLRSRIQAISPAP